jgi:hypothetical protein
MEPVAHFGLGENSHIKHVEVRWSDGKISTIQSPKPNQLIRISHPSS